MKRILAFVFCLALLASLCACGDGEPLPSSSDVTISEKDWVDVLMDDAEELYSWFTGCNRPRCDQSSAIELDGAVYMPVTEPGLGDTAALRGRLSELFTESIVDSLMEKVVYSGAPMFRDIGGTLYFCSDVSGQVPWDIGQRQGAVISQTDTEIIYHLELTHNYFASSYTAVCDYRLILGEDGQWRFASFRLPALLIAEQMFQDSSE